MGKTYKGRCMKCKKEVEIKDPKAFQWPNKMWVAKGVCSEDGKTGVNRIIGKEKPADLEE